MSKPTIDVTIDENYFVEALTGPARSSSYLDNFPDDIFDISSESRLYKFLYTLIGPAGVSFLKLNYFYARLQLEEHGLQNEQLDKLYGNPFKFARSFNESYLENWKGVLDSGSWDLIKALDESYRQRTIDYFHAARLGPTPEGMRLAAKSALGYNTKIVENYQHIFNQHSDQILNYNLIINSNENGYYNLEEFTIAPNDASVDDASADQIAAAAQAEVGNNYSQEDMEKLHLLEKAIQNLKPVNTIYNTSVGQSDSSPINIKNTLASSEFYQVNRFVTGNSKVPWPTSNDPSSKYNSIYWIESGVEKEAPKNANGAKQHYQGFYQPSKVTSSNNPSAGNLDTNKALIKKYPMLKNLPVNVAWTPDKSLANYADPLTVTHQNQMTNTGFINDVYPIDYLKLDGVPSVQYNVNKFWISKLDTEGNSEILDIHFDKTNAVNFLIFEVLSAPIDIDISHDINVQKQLSLTISSVTCGSTPGSTTYTYNATNASNLITTGDILTIKGITEGTSTKQSTVYNGTFEVTSVSSSSFQVTGSVANPSIVANTVNATIYKNQLLGFQPVDLDPLYPHDTSLDYKTNSLNKWIVTPYTFDMVFTNTIRITFSRNQSTYLNQSSFLVDNSVSPPQTKPWPIVVRNLRVGRNIV